MLRKPSSQINNAVDVLFLYVGKITSLITVFLWLASCGFCTEQYIKKRLPCYDPLSFPFHPKKYGREPVCFISNIKWMCFTSALVCFVVCKIELEFNAKCLLWYSPDGGEEWGLCWCDAQWGLVPTACS